MTVRGFVTSALVFAVVGAGGIGVLTGVGLRGQGKVRARTAGGVPDGVEGLPVGRAAPRLELKDTTGETVSVGGPSGRAATLLFVSPRCGYCRTLLGRARASESLLGEVVVVSTGPGGDAVETAQLVGGACRVLVDATGSAAEEFGVGSVPKAYVVGADGLIAATASGLPAVEELLLGDRSAKR